TAKPAASAAPGGSALASGSAAAAVPAAPPEGGSVLVLHVADVALAKMQQISLPADFEKQLKLLVGTTLRLRLGPNGILAGVDVAVPQGTPEGIADFVTLLADVLGLFEVPAPDKPVGVGGYWMVSDRRLASGLPVLRYRLFRVEELKDGVAKVSVTVKQYLADGKLDIQGPPGAEVKLVRFDSEGTLSLALRPGATVPERGKAQEPFVLTLAVGGQQAQQGIETVAQLVAGGAALPGDDDDDAP
ncbi:MAG: hypothetical protein HY908_36885, partial [Myxococcales bacterium]|nr:hypothetical protein [Myxococcales bacterium]